MSPVTQYGFVDLVSCLGQGYVPTSTSVDDECYNGLEEPSAVGISPVDVFEAIRASNTVAKATPVSAPSPDPSISSDVV